MGHDKARPSKLFRNSSFRTRHSQIEKFLYRRLIEPMYSYIIRRLLISIPMVLGMTFVTFMAVHFSPGDFLAEMKMNPQISSEVVEQYEERYHLDKPAVIQYAYWLGNIFRGDMGHSFRHNLPVARIIMNHVPATLLLVVSGMLFTWLLAIPMGVYCAVHQHKLRDRALSVVAFIGMAIPNFFFALLLLYFAAVTGLLPLGGMRSAEAIPLETALLESEDIADPSALASKLLAPDEPLSEFVAGRISQETRELLEKAPESPEARSALADDLNRLIQGDIIYTTERFADIDIPEDVRERAYEPLAGFELVDYNRELLDYAWPGMVASRKRLRYFWISILDVAKHLIIPTIVIGTAGMAGLQRITRGNMLESLRQQYITTARAKGLPEGRVVYRHALRTAINPLVTIFGFQLSSLLSGAALTEIILDWPGLGSLLLEAVRAQDIYLVMGSVLISGGMLILGNLAADILLAVVDPRISHGGLRQ